MLDQSVGGTARFRPLRAILDWLSSIRFGMTILFFILVYASVLSALPQVRGALEVTEMEAFRHWLFVGLIAVFCLCIVTVTLTRIRWNVLNLGVLTTHTGLITLGLGAVWYFGTKVEGDLLLQTPRIEIVRIGSSTPRVFTEFQARAGETWQRTMPAIGGAVTFEVLSTATQGLLSVASAQVRANIGGVEQVVTLNAHAPTWTPVSDKLALQLHTQGPETTFYNSELAALYYRKAGDGDFHKVRIPGLPLHRERFIDDGPPPRSRSGTAETSKRTWPHIALGPLAIPTGWFEAWRMPIALDTPEVPFDVRVTGYLPYIAGMDTIAAPGQPGDPAAISYTVEAGATRVAEALFDDPVGSLSSRWPMEFRWVDSAAERDALLAPMAGIHELTIEVLDPPVRKTVAIQAGQTVDVEGTSYKLNVVEVLPSWPMMTPGFENAVSPVARIDVTCDGKRYNRTVVQRFPELSQDIDESGKRHKDGPYDPNLKLAFRTVEGGRVYLIAGPGIAPVLAIFSGDGSLGQWEVQPRTPVTIQAPSFEMKFTLSDLLPHGRSQEVPMVESLDRRRPNMGRQFAALRLRVQGRGELAGWSESAWMLFSAYPHVEARPLRLSPPGTRDTYELIWSRYPKDLGAEVAPVALKTELFPGRMVANTWRSDFLVRRSPEGPVTTGYVATNQTFALGHWTFFQSGAANDNWSFTILGVGNRRGVWTMLIGCTLIALGSLYAFYVKPLIRKRRAEAAIREAEAGASASAGRAHPVGQPELTGVSS